MIGAIVIVCVIVIAVVFLTIYDKKKNSKTGKEQKSEEIVKPNIISVSVLGTRTGEETRVLATYNFTIYSLLVKYDNGTQEVIECSGNSSEFKKYIPFITDKNEKGGETI